MAIEKEVATVSKGAVRLALGLATVALIAVAANMGWNWSQKRAEKNA